MPYFLQGPTHVTVPYPRRLSSQIRWYTRGMWWWSFSTPKNDCEKKPRSCVFTGIRLASWVSQGFKVTTHDIIPPERQAVRYIPVERPIPALTGAHALGGESRQPIRPYYTNACTCKQRRSPKSILYTRDMRCMWRERDSCDGAWRPNGS